MNYRIVKPMTVPSKNAPPKAVGEAIQQLARSAGKAHGESALFLGIDGAGKTLAAEELARAARTDVYHVDLSRVVSTFVGETEKNLDAVFDDAERAGAQLFFDEADALFGKRTDVRDAHDRYANVEIGYLLQRIEAFPGVVILATNAGPDLDPAVVRRFRTVVPPPARLPRDR